MRWNSLTSRRIASSTAAIALVVAGALWASRGASSQEMVKRTMLLKSADPGSAAYDVQTAIADIAPTGSTGKHIHHGLETGYVLQGTLTLDVEGKPRQMVNAGEPYQIDATLPHNASNLGSTPVKVLAVYVIEKGKPLADPVK